MVALLINYLEAFPYYQSIDLLVKSYFHEHLLIFLALTMISLKLYLIYFTLICTISSSHSFIQKCPKHLNAVNVSEELLSGWWYVVRRSYDYPFYERENVCTLAFQYTPVCRKMHFAFDYNQYGMYSY